MAFDGFKPNTVVLTDEFTASLHLYCAYTRLVRVSHVILVAGVHRGNACDAKVRTANGV